MAGFLKTGLCGFAGVVAAIVSTSQIATASESLQALLDRKAATIERLHYKAKKALVTAAQDKTFSQYFKASSHDERAGHKHKIDQISLAVQDRFRVEEMCLIDPKGAEISRIVGEKIAYDLADDEASAGFFAPGFAAAPRKVHVSKIYMSADANKWVVAYVTPIIGDGEKKAILHYEHTLEVYQAALNRGMGDTGQVVLAIDGDGYIVSDSRSKIAVDIQDGAEDRKPYFKHFDLSGMSLDALRQTVGADKKSGNGSVEASGKTYQVAYKLVGDWTVLAVDGL